MQDVTGIALSKGARGGYRWRLTLACGHVTGREIIPAPIVQGRLRGGRVRLRAPTRVKCRRCAWEARLGERRTMFELT